MKVSQKDTMIFKQIHPKACGIAVCRAILYHAKGIELSEQQVIIDLPWVESRLDESVISTDALADVISHYGLNAHVLWSSDEQNIATYQIPDVISEYQSRTLCVVEKAKDNYHAVLIRRIDLANDNVIFMDPENGRNSTIQISHFDSMRKCKDGRELFRELLYA